MNAGAYSDLKAAWHLDRIAALRLGEQIAPVELQLILSDYCNQDCFFCAYRASNGLSSEQFVTVEDGKTNHNPKRMIPKAKAAEIIGDAAMLGVKCVIFTGGGEPTVHPEHLELFDLALSLGLECSLNTNGVVFRVGWEEVLPRFAYVRFSVEAANANEYAKVRNCPEAHYRMALRIACRPKLDVVVFFSPSAVRGLIGMLEPACRQEQALAILNQLILACVGPTTAQAADQAGIKVSLMPTSTMLKAWWRLWCNGGCAPDWRHRFSRLEHCLAAD